MKTYDYEVYDGRKRIKQDSLNAESLEEAHSKIAEDFEDCIIIIDRIKFPPVVDTEVYSIRLTYDVKKEFDKAKGDLTSNHFLKTLLELYNKEY